jgi:methionine synthase II (cobalamin-independent)
MMAGPTKELLMVGSVPLDTAEEVMRALAEKLGPSLDCFPDGEVGERHRWITFQAYRVMHGHPEIETLTRPAPINGVESWRPRDIHDYWSFRVRPGVERVRFGDPGWRLGYAHDAANSYFVFKTLRAQGVIPGAARFQVCIPLPLSVLYLQFRDPADWDRVGPGYEAAMRDEIATIVRQIPARDLAIQWDCASEMVDLENFLPWTPSEGKLERLVGEIERLEMSAIPEDVWLGLHLCYGTLGGWPMIMPKDFGLCVRVANAVAAVARRRFDFIHMPGPANRFDDDFYRPLSDLKVPGARIYLGMIHDHELDAEPLRRRIEVARRYIPEFGLGAPCGFGRRKREEIPRALEAHRVAAETLRASQA